MIHQILLLFMSCISCSLYTAPSDLLRAWLPPTYWPRVLHLRRASSLPALAGAPRPGRLAPLPG